MKLLFGRQLLLVCDQKPKPSNWRISAGYQVGFWVLGDRLSLSCSKRLSVEEISLVFLIFPRQLLGSSFFQNMKEFVVSLLRKKNKKIYWILILITSIILVKNAYLIYCKCMIVTYILYLYCNYLHL